MREAHLSVMKVIYECQDLSALSNYQKIGLDPPSLSNHLQGGHEIVLLIGHSHINK